MVWWRSGLSVTGKNSDIQSVVLGLIGNWTMELFMYEGILFSSLCNISIYKIFLRQVSAREIWGAVCGSKRWNALQEVMLCLWSLTVCRVDLSPLCPGCRNGNKKDCTQQGWKGGGGGERTSGEWGQFSWEEALHWNLINWIITVKLSRSPHAICSFFTVSACVSKGTITSANVNLWRQTCPE